MLGERLRKSRTAAGFVPKPCETAIQKLPKGRLRSPLEEREKRLLPARKPLRNERLGSLQATRQTEQKGARERLRKSRTAAGFVPKPCATAIQKMPKRRLRSPLEEREKRLLPARKPLRNERLGSLQATRQTYNKKVLGERLRKSGTAAGFEPNAHKKTPVKVLRVTFGSTTNLWKNGLKKPKPCQTLATLKHQQAMENRMRKSGTAAGFDPNAHKKNTSKSASRHLWIHYKPLEAMENRMRKSGTAAGFEPNAHKNTPVKMLRVTFGSTTNLWKNGHSRIRAQRTQKNTSKSASRHLWIHYKPLEKRPQEA